MCPRPWLSAADSASTSILPSNPSDGSLPPMEPRLLSQAIRSQPHPLAPPLHDPSEPGFPPPCLTQGPPSPGVQHLPAQSCSPQTLLPPSSSPAVPVRSASPALPSPCLSQSAIPECVCVPVLLLAWETLEHLWHWPGPPLLTASTLPLMASIRPAKNRKMAPCNDTRVDPCLCGPTGHMRAGGLRQERGSPWGIASGRASRASLPPQC